MRNFFMDEYIDRYATCYWCGEKAESHEHVPPQNLFPKNFRTGLITVGACKKHNEAFSKIDERLRFHMTFLSNSNVAREHFKDKVLKGLTRPESLKLAIDLSQNYFPNYFEKNLQRESYESVYKYFEKIIKGLLFFHFGVVHRYLIAFFSNKIEHTEMTANAHFYFYTVEDEYKNKWTDGKCHNKTIFEYKYFFDKTNNRFFVIMKFYGEHQVIGVALPEGRTIDDYSLKYEEYLEKRKNCA